MTAYKNFTNDFPNRCLRILDEASKCSSYEERRVTLLLMVASAAFVGPFERLKPDGEYSSHAFGENRLHSAAAKRLSKLMQERFSGSLLCPEMGNSWRLAKDVANVAGDLDSWLPSAGLQPFSRDKQVTSVLKLVRNALAHGNIHTEGIPEISGLVLVQDHLVGDPPTRDGFEVVTVSAADFEVFIRAWIDFLRNTWGLRLAA